MAKVTNQDLPTDQIEDALDPPIEFIDQYKKTLALPSPHPGLPAGEEILTGTKKEARPAFTDAESTFQSEGTSSQRDKFRECLECWKKQVDQEADEDPCHSAKNRHYVKPWVYVPGAPYPFFRQFMSDCLNYLIANPPHKYPPCEDLTPDPETFEFCPNDVKDFTVSNGINPAITEVNCGSITGPLQWTAPESVDECPDTVTINFTDDDGRKGCAIGLPLDEEECCCSDPPPLAILYTSLQMACSGEQELSVDPANPGCPPYVWGVSEGGGSLNTTEGDTVTYTAPSTNANCENNPIITLHDSCDQEVELHLAVNCYGSNIAGTMTQWVEYSYVPCYAGNSPVYSAGTRAIYCDGGLSSFEAFGDYDLSPNTPPPTPANPETCYWQGYDLEGCYQCNHYSHWNRAYGVYEFAEEYTDGYNWCCWGMAYGCCPINPFTGLPY